MTWCQVAVLTTLLLMTGQNEVLTIPVQLVSASWTHSRIELTHLPLLVERPPGELTLIPIGTIRTRRTQGGPYPSQFMEEGV